MQCCNQVPISIEKTSGLFTVHKLGLRKLDLKEPLAKAGDDELNLRTQKTFVVRIANVGAGPAIGTRARWEVDSVIQMDGNRIKIPDERINHNGALYTWPAIIASGQTALVRHLPLCLEEDENLSIAQVNGWLLLTCKDSLNNEIDFRQPFTLDTVYSPEKESKYKEPRLSFHFFDVEGGELTHTMAKPVLPERSK